MKKLTALVALALLAVAGTGFAVTCAQDNVPAATLLVPYFRVGGTGAVLPNDIPDTSGTDTLCAVTNVSSADIIIHVTVWNKYSKAVLDFNVPLTGYDVVFWSMRDILNGKLNVNPAYQHLYSGIDPCGQTGDSVDPYIVTDFVRFSAISADDRTKAISVYNAVAFSGAFRAQVWTSLDESSDIIDWTAYGAAGAGVIDATNPVCTGTAATTTTGDFSGYVTIDLANFCTLFFPDAYQFYSQDAIATVGWGTYPGSNILVGDVFYKDQKPGDTTANIGNISGDPMVHIEFDSRLNPWNNSIVGVNQKTFYGRYYNTTDNGLNGVDNSYGFIGDGREPLGNEYTFRYLQTAAPTALKTWITVWRSDLYESSAVNLCTWLGATAANKATTAYMADSRKITVNMWDNDENVVSTTGGPSGSPTGSNQYIFLETQRLAVTPNGTVVPASFLGGWIDLVFGTATQQAQNLQSWVGVQHSGLGLAMTVGHAAQLKPGTGTCVTVTTPASLSIGGVAGALNVTR